MPRTTVLWLLCLGLFLLVSCHQPTAHGPDTPVSGGPGVPSPSPFGPKNPLPRGSTEPSVHEQPRSATRIVDGPATPELPPQPATISQRDADGTAEPSQLPEVPTAQDNARTTPQPPSEPTALPAQNANQRDASSDAPSVDPLLREAVDCHEIWPSGFEGGTRECIAGTMAAICGRQLTVYYHRALQHDPDTLRYMDSVVPAMQTACNAYAPLVQLARDVRILFASQDEPDPRVDGVAMRTVRTTDAVGLPQVDPCPIVVYPGVIRRRPSVARFQQLLAHELFHCLELQEFGAVNWYLNKWWSEGMAEYFSNVAYPTTNLEHRKHPHFDARSFVTPILDMEYEANVLWQYLGNELGDQWLISLMRGVPKFAGRAEQLAYLCGRIDQDLLHRFGKTYLERNITDTGGGRIPEFTPDPGEEISVERSTVIPVEVAPFVLHRSRITLPPGKRYTIVPSMGDGNGRLSFQDLGLGSGWRTGRLEVMTACGGRWLQLLATTTSTRAFRGTVTINIEEEYPSFVSGTASGARDCLIGTWRADLAQLEPYYQTESAGKAAVQARGTRTLRFHQDGTAEYSDTPWEITWTYPRNQSIRMTFEVDECKVRYEVVDGNFLTGAPVSIRGRGMSLVSWGEQLSCLSRPALY